ncbi:MAG TPA: VWA domain-containing protein, partial [Terriglobales bacterium]|nr:VWA domain-containing protein [Terriglobales bacterium]
MPAPAAHRADRRRFDGGNWNSPDVLQNHLRCLHILPGRKMFSDALFALCRHMIRSEGNRRPDETGGPTKAGPMLQWWQKAGLNKAGWWPLALALILTLVFALTVVGQDTTDVHITPRVDPTAKLPAPDPGLRAGLPILKSNVNLVLVPVTVTDPMDRLVTGLDKSNFTIYQDKQAEQIRNLSSDDAPISVGVILDISGSMGDKIQRAREAVSQFLETANPEDEFFLITFSDGPHLVSPFTSRVQDIESQLPTVESKGMTALLDAIYLGIDEMHHAQY